MAIHNNQLTELIKELKNKIDEHDIQFAGIYETLENMLDEQVDKKAKEIKWKNGERIGLKNNYKCCMFNFE